MKSLFVVGQFLCLLSIVFAATSSGYYGQPEYPGKCVIRPNVIISPGTHTAPDACERIECSESGYADIATCGVELAAPGCSLGDYKNPHADYPDCCERYIHCKP